MTDSTVFAQKTDEPVTSPVSSSTAFQLPPEVIEFVGIGKKYSNEIDALKSIPHAQKHIQTLEQENATIKAELEKRKTTEQLLEEIKASNVQQTTTNVPVGMDQNAIAQLIEKTLEQKQVQKSAQENISTVTNAFKSKFGEKAEEVYIALAKDTGMSIQYLNNLASTSPTAVLKLAGLTQTTIIDKTKGNINTNSLNTNNTSIESAKVTGGSTKELVRAWKAAGVKVGKTT